jgi:site-specific DNA-methyltransferase (adenine-specific)
MSYKILQGDNRETLKTIPDNSIDAIVTDPPYGISFLGKDWDSFRNSKVTKNSTVKNLGSGMRMTSTEENVNFQLWCEEWARECFRVLKPGGYILSFCAARMYHRMTVGLEDAGFEIRDQIMWIYSSGFPKSQDIGRSIQRGLGVKEKKTIKGGAVPKDKMLTPYAKEDEYSQPVPTDSVAKQWEGWGTCLKPAHEPIALARKPTKLTYANNVQEWRVGGLNIDATRVGDDKMPIGVYTQTGSLFNPNKKSAFAEETNTGRFPSNVIGEIEEQYQKYFYCPKVSRKERHIGLKDPGPQTARARDSEGNVLNYAEKKAGASANVLVEQFQLSSQGNNHPTVKPVALMEYLIKLITPPGGTVLDPFNGSGSTGMAAVGLGYEYIGCELDPAYVEISENRIQAWLEQDTTSNLFKDLFSAPK